VNVLTFTDIAIILSFIDFDVDFDFDFD
jgi:hypothetical protein